MVVFNKHVDGIFYVDKSEVRIPLNGSELVVGPFFEVGSVLGHYSVVAGIGRHDGRTYLIGRGLSVGRMEKNGNLSYRCREIGNCGEDVKTELERYKKGMELEAEIKLWSELFDHKPAEPKKQSSGRQLPLDGFEDLSCLRK